LLRLFGRLQFDGGLVFASCRELFCTDARMLPIMKSTKVLHTTIGAWTYYIVTESRWLHQLTLVAMKSVSLLDGKAAFLDEPQPHASHLPCFAEAEPWCSCYGSLF